MPKTAEEIRSEIARNAKIFAGSSPLSKGHKGSIVHDLNKYLAGDDMRRWCLGWLFGRGPDLKQKSTKSVSDGEWRALDEWVGAFEVAGKWDVDIDFPAEALIVLTKAVAVYAQLERFVPAESEIALSQGDMLVQAVGHLGGVVTQVTDERGKPVTPHVSVVYSTPEEFVGDESELF